MEIREVLAGYHGCPSLRGHALLFLAGCPCGRPSKNFGQALQILEKQPLWSRHPARPSSNSHSGSQRFDAHHNHYSWRRFARANFQLQCRDWNKQFRCIWSLLDFWMVQILSVNIRHVICQWRFGTCQPNIKTLNFRLCTAEFDDVCGNRFLFCCVLWFPMNESLAIRC